MRLMISILLIISIIGIVDAGEGDKYWHASARCDDCHNTILPEIQSNDISGNCICHYPPENPVWHTKVDIQIIKGIHGVEPCLKCHVNSIATLTQDSVHKVHNGSVKCEGCHGQDQIKRPEIICTSCHGTQVHSIHDDVMDIACIACHGEYAKGFTEVPEVGSISMRIPIVEEKKHFPTIIDVVRALLKI